MKTRQPFEIIYAPLVKEHLRAIERKYHALIRSAIETQLRHEPDVETRNRKPLKRHLVFEVDWELRCGPQNRFRIFCEVNQKQQAVYIWTIGIKRRTTSMLGERKSSYEDCTGCRCQGAI